METTLEPIIRSQTALTHTYSAGTPFERNAVEDVSFEVMPGEFLGIIGHTGSGKSTLIQHLNGLLQPTAGQVFCWTGRTSGPSPRKSARSASRWAWCSSTRSTSCLRRRSTRTSPSVPTNMGLDEEEIDRRVREAAAFVGLREDAAGKVPL